MILKGIVLLVIMALTFLSFGRVFCLIIKEKNVSFSENILYGCVSAIFLFELLSLPFLVLKNNFYLLCCLFFLVCCFTVIVALLSLKKHPIDIRIMQKQNIHWVKVSVVILICLHALYSSVMHFNCYDDGGYLAITNEAIENNIIEFNDTVAYSGNYFFKDACARPSVESWGLFVGFWAKIFNMPSAILAHTFLPLLLIPIYYLAAKEVFKRLIKNNKELYICILLYIVMNVFYGNGYFISSYLSVGAWVGKAALFHLILPLLMANCIDIYQENDSIKTWISILCLTVAGVGFTATAVYTIPLYFICFGFPYVVYLFITKQGNRLKDLMKKVFLSVCGLIFIGVFAVVQMFKIGNGYGELYADLSIKNVYIKAFSYNKLYFILFVIALLLLIILEKNKMIRLMVLGSITLNSVLFLNPTFAPYIAKYVTGMPVYWRVVLLFPVYVVIPMGVIYLFRLFKTSWIKAIIFISIMMVCCKNGGMFSIYTTHENLYMIPNDVLDLCEYFEEENVNDGKIVIFAEQSINKFFRQYSAKFDVVVGRNDQVTQNELGQQYLTMYSDVFEKQIITSDTILLLKQFNVEYVILPYELDSSQEFEMVAKINSYYIYVII